MDGIPKQRAVTSLPNNRLDPFGSHAYKEAVKKPTIRSIIVNWKGLKCLYNIFAEYYSILMCNTNEKNRMHTVTYMRVVLIIALCKTLINCV